MVDTVTSEAQKLKKDIYLELFDIDTTPIGGATVFRFVQGSQVGMPVKWMGNTYVPMEIKADGYELNGQGAFSQPTLRVSNVYGELISALVAYSDLKRCTVTRWRTFRKFLDEQTGEVSTQRHFPVDIHTIDQKVNETAESIEWKLMSAMDQQGVRLPRRKILATYCGKDYRQWDAEAGEFDYSKAQCRYAGDAMFDIHDEPTLDPTRDACSQGPNGCAKRFGVLEAWFFLGVGRVLQ